VPAELLSVDESLDDLEGTREREMIMEASTVQEVRCILVFRCRLVSLLQGTTTGFCCRQSYE
jgi:hypothetical protein